MQKGPTRRTVLQSALSAAALAAYPLPRFADASSAKFKLTAAPGRATLVPNPDLQTPVWCYNGAVPGPILRLRQHSTLRVDLDNQLGEETTIHWHGVRLPNAMDGVPGLTQTAVPPGEAFSYEFTCPDAGTFWYHPHQNSSAQVGRGLYGALIVDEEEAIPVDRDVVWVISDWRLQNDASIQQDFHNLHDKTHAGRIGNVVTVNGSVIDTFEVRSGERIRLRLINAANARIFALSFFDQRPTIIAIDGQPVKPHEPVGGRVVLGPATRVDLILDCIGRPGDRHRVIDDFYSGMTYRFVDLSYIKEEPIRSQFPSVPALPDNKLAEPDLAQAERRRIVLTGGMMGGMKSALVDGREMDVMSMFRSGVAWALNGIASTHHAHTPLFTCVRNRSYILELVNETVFPHPMHLHGHSFRVLSRNGQPEQFRPWQDTVLLLARERAEIAFVADNPGDWMFHCHILEHQAAGMMGVIRVE